MRLLKKRCDSNFKTKNSANVKITCFLFCFIVLPFPFLFKFSYFRKDYEETDKITELWHLQRCNVFPLISQLYYSVLQQNISNKMLAFSWWVKNSFPIPDSDAYDQRSWVDHFHFLMKPSALLTKYGRLFRGWLALLKPPSSSPLSSLSAERNTLDLVILLF